MTSQIKGPLSNSEKKEQSRAKASLIVNVTEDILVHMEDHDVSKADLSRKLGKSRAYVSKLFSGESNMTLNTLSDICFAVGLRPEIILLDTNFKVVNYSTSRHVFMKETKEVKNECWHETDNSKIIDFGFASRKIKSMKTLNFDNEGYKYGCK